MMCLRQDVINRKNLLKLKLNSIWNKIHKLLPPKVDLKPLLGGPLAIGLRSWKYNVFTWLSASNQFLAIYVHLAQSDFDVSAIIRIE